jgi:hypothetical protein
VHIDCPAAGFAGPAFPLHFYELPDPETPDLLTIIDHVHTVLFPVPLIQLPEPFAGKLSTGMMVPVSYLFAGKDAALFTALPVRRITSTAAVLRPEKHHANRTVHAAGCNQCRPERILRCH